VRESLGTYETRRRSESKGRLSSAQVGSVQPLAVQRTTGPSRCKLLGGIYLPLFLYLRIHILCYIGSESFGAKVKALKGNSPSYKLRFRN
jgi:hypothetical protein